MFKTKFDIAICVYNEEEAIDKLLNFLINEKFKNDLRKILVVCSGCTDNSEEVVNKYSKINDTVELIHEEKRRGKPSAINKILKVTKAQVVVFIDADGIPTKGSIDRLLSYFEDPQIGAVCGHPRPIKGFWLDKIIYKLHYNLYLPLKAKKGTSDFLSAQLHAVRPMFKSIPISLIEDDASIARKIMDLGYKIDYCQNALTEFSSPSNILEYIKQRTRIMTGNQQIRSISIFNRIYQEPIITIKYFLMAFLKINWLKLITALFIEIYCFFRYRSYKKGVLWDKTREI
ncbi:MAG: glycosyltransferase [Candidatus Helarchaeota archaeon]